MSDDSKPMSEEELRASVFAFAADLSERAGVKLNPEKVWREVKARRARTERPDTAT
ncbi:hypothetical protein [Mycobacteroides franklinii]|uniref:hypothetical protein n=1 Tax=Mycobacteroides franklinii TaxID=948102 RepID=UPI0012FFA508|nr:hypothetical protein [Mycobacteroides franklinii]